MPGETPSPDDVPIFVEAFSDLILRQQGTEQVTNEAIPRIGGIRPPDGTLTVTIDSETNPIEVPVRYHGDGRVWEAVVPELSDGPHTIGWMSSEGGGYGFAFTVKATEAERAQSAQRNQEWLEAGGRDEWVERQLSQSDSVHPPYVGLGADGRASKAYRDAKPEERAGAGVDQQAGQQGESGETFAEQVTREQAERLATPEGQKEYAEVLHEAIAAQQGLDPGDPGYLEFMNDLEEFRNRMAQEGISADDNEYLERLNEEFDLKSASSGGGGSGIGGGGSGGAPLTASPVVPVPQGSGAPPPPAGGQGGGAGGGDPGGQSGQGGGQGEQAPAAQQGEQAEPPQPRTGDAPPQPPAVLGLEKGNAGFINA